MIIKLKAEANLLAVRLSSVRLNNFPPPKKACLSVLLGLFTDCKANEWIGPAFFDIWGAPKRKKLHTASADEANKILAIADKIYKNVN